jgi:myo-inositol-1(or 4)-monophosphatase
MKPFITRLSKQAGNILMKYFGKVKYVKEKSNESYFTNADIESEKYIISEIERKFPDHNIVSEEAGTLDKKSQYTWYIDPLDGTHNFMHKLPLFGTSIALALKDKVQFGAIYLPFFKELYFAQRGKGSFLNGKRIKVSRNNILKKSFIVSDLQLRYFPSKKLKLLRNLRGKVYDIRTLGCASYALALVAGGSAEAFITLYTRSWDMAAGSLIVDEAGGKFTDLEGKTWSPKEKQFLISNGKVHGRLLQIIG